MKLPRISIRSGAAATLSVLLAATAIAAMAPSQALNSTLVGPRDSTRAGFPAYYTDDSGVALQLCIDGTARCGGATLKSDGAGGPGPGVGPDGEGFYFVATTSLSAPGLSLDIGNPPNPSSPSGPGFGYGSGPPDGPNYTQVYGTFASTAAVNGSVVFGDYANCGNAIGIWSATRK